MPLAFLNLIVSQYFGKTGKHKCWETSTLNAQRHLLSLSQSQSLLGSGMPVWWNALPSEIQALWDLMQFCRACKTQMLRQTYGWGGGIPSALASPCSGSPFANYHPNVHSHTWNTISFERRHTSCIKSLIAIWLLNFKIVVMNWILLYNY